ncbi:hypothetical protein B0H17DRAFT_528620 [Mycena rosella]|uniref:Uncharacterized protein n=1 Tax=Mycena rosella TaxID=1033263 RepID=A0AAD7GYB6_MYCRO|nr:hypothetical protein B0H17DRAFT_528620 [Mycena rosella]
MGLDWTGLHWQASALRTPSRDAKHFMSRVGGPVANGASRASGVPSMAASYNPHIDDLVQRKRTLEHTNKKLTDEVALEADRHKREVKDLQTQWHEERLSWREGCNRLISCHHLAHLRLSAKLSTAEAALLKEMELCRQEKVARLHRDFQITMFRIREAELDAQVEDLEDALQEARRGQSSHFSELEDRINSQKEEIGSLEEEKTAAENELLQLRESYSRLQVSAESAKTKLERVTLQFDGAQTTNAELERKNDELKRANADIKRQLDRWQNLETKGGEEVETLRKQRIDLEVDVKALEGRLEKKEAELHKAKTKVAQFKDNIGEFERYINERRDEMKDVESQLAKAKKQIERLQIDLDAERAARPTSPLKSSPTVSEDEVADGFTEVPPPSSPVQPPSKKPRSKSGAVAPSKNGRNKPAAEPVAGPSNAVDSDIEEVPGPQERLRTKTKGQGADTDGSKKPKAKPRSTTVGRDSGESEDDARVTKKGKAKAVEEVDDSDSVVPQKESSRPKTAVRGKRKRDETAAGSSKRASSELPVVERPKPNKPRSKAAGGGRAAGVQPRGTTVVSDDESDEPARKKKKRTIGIFPANSQPTSFNFLTTGDTGGIEIPTVLSPVRPSDVVPSRSNSMIGRVASGLLGSFGRRN